MGSCIDPPKVTDPAEQIRLLSELRNEVLMTIKESETKISKAKTDMQEINEKMKQIENDLRQNQYSYSETEKLQKAQNVLELKTDYQRVNKSLELFNANHTNFKNSLQMIESKINEIKNNEILKIQVEVIDGIGDTDPTPVLRKNYEHQLEQQKKDEEMLNLLKSGNNVLNPSLPTADDLLKQILLGNGTTDGAPPAY